MSERQAWSGRLVPCCARVCVTPYVCVVVDVVTVCVVGCAVCVTAVLTALAALGHVVVAQLLTPELLLYAVVLVVLQSSVATVLPAQVAAAVSVVGAVVVHVLAT